MLHKDEAMIASLKENFNQILRYLETEAQKDDIHKVEQTLFTEMMNLSRSALQRHVDMKEKQHRGKNVKGPDGEILPFHGVRKTAYYSIFGEISIPRPYYYRKGEGVFPLEEKLNLPERKYSYLLMRWATALATANPFDQSLSELKELLGIDLVKSALVKGVSEVSEGVEEFYRQKPAPLPDTEGELLVAAIDCKGVPIRREEPRPKRHHLKKGEKRQKKKLSTVSSVYTIGRYCRSAEEIVREVRNKEGEKEKRPKPQNKRNRATLKSKEDAFVEVARELKKRDPEGEKERVVLMDGDRGLERLARKHLKGAVLILDIYHVLGYLWLAAHAFFAEGSSEAEEFVTSRFMRILEGGAGYVIGGLRQRLRKRALSKRRREVVEKVIGYLSARVKYMRYDLYLERGYPIGSGVVEGACRHLVKDRMELSGMRWSISGAEAMLRLRSVRLNGDWEAFWSYWTRCERKRIYGGVCSLEPVGDNAVSTAS